MRAPDTEPSVLKPSVLPVWPFLLATIAGAAAGLVARSVTLGASAACVAVLCGMCFATVPVSRRKVVAAESTERFISVLANQASVSRTVTEAINRAAPLMEGSIGRAAQALAQDCRTIGIAEAAPRFAQRANAPAAKWLAEVLVNASVGGGQWLAVMGVLEAEASQDSATKRHFHRQVAAALTQVAAATLIGAGVVVGSARINTTSWEWLLSPAGGSVLFAASALSALLSWKLLAGAWEMLR